MCETLIQKIYRGEGIEHHICVKTCVELSVLDKKKHLNLGQGDEISTNVWLKFQKKKRKWRKNMMWSASTSRPI